MRYSSMQLTETSSACAGQLTAALAEWSRLAQASPP